MSEPLVFAAEPVATVPAQPIPTVVVDPPATSSATVDPKPTLADLESGAVNTLRKVQSSLTIQGGLVSGAATFVATKGAALLVALGVSAAVAGEATSDVAAVLGSIGVLMVFVGRLRLGDLK